MLNFIKLNRMKFIFRSLVLVTALLLAIFDYQLLIGLVYYNIYGITVYHVLWAIIMLGMIQVIFPVFNNYVSCGKLFAKHFRAPKVQVSLSQSAKAFTQNAKGAVKSAAAWLFILASIGWLYNLGYIDKVGLILIAIFFYWSDQFCVNVWCPFRAWLIGNKCCNTCRIYNWGQFMMVSPLIFIKSFWSLSLVVMSLLILIQWEWQNFRHPERFTEQTNELLKCSSCLKAECQYMKHQ